jgi:hypothetical protein
MFKKIAGVLIIMLFSVSCGQQHNERKISEAQQVVAANISELLSNPLEYENKVVKIEGIISHVCRHSGDKMRVLQEGSELSIQVMLGEFAGRIDPASEGLRIILSGSLAAEAAYPAALTHDTHEGECAATREAGEKMRSHGMNAAIRAYITLIEYETM